MAICLDPPKRLRRFEPLSSPGFLGVDRSAVARDVAGSARRHARGMSDRPSESAGEGAV
ncbi:hypothetical protein [Salinigranum marinum]|uniref:hypothetical protein n=1 Tax=Salinigranum marinum TaxID=1515595 RepID=UPI002989CA02|nr:hypothetical protein [Salinigranum marinum]